MMLFNKSSFLCWNFTSYFVLFVEIIKKVKGKAMKFAAKNVYLKKNQKMREESIKVEVMQAPVSNYSDAVSQLVKPTCHKLCEWVPGDTPT